MKYFFCFFLIFITTQGTSFESREVVRSAGAATSQVAVTHLHSSGIQYEYRHGHYGQYLNAAPYLMQTAEEIASTHVARMNKLRVFFRLLRVLLASHNLHRTC